jgi:hypothetical protein
MELAGKAIFGRVFVGDNLVVPCESDNGELFWLLFCDKPNHAVKDTFIDAYKYTYYEGDELIGVASMTYFGQGGGHISSMMI